MTRPFSLRVHGEDHHHDRNRDAQGRTPSDVAAEQEFLHRTSTVIHALRDGGYRLVVPQWKLVGWATSYGRDELPDPMQTLRSLADAD
jgi:hypothetical protein